MAKNIYHDSLVRVLQSVMKNADIAEETARALIDRYRTLEDIVTAPIPELATIAGKNAATLLKLAGCVASRRETDAFRFGEVCTRSEIVRYFRAHFIGKHVETLCIMTFDADGRAIAMHEVSEGTVNASGVLPRKLLECALADGAASLALAHNHPHGVAVASHEDRAMTASITEVLRLTGIEMRFHVLIAGHYYEIISPLEDVNAISRLQNRI